MPEYAPLTKEERERLVTGNKRVVAECAELEWEIDWATRDLIRYEATVEERDKRIAALEAEVARLRPLAETGEAVGGMPVDTILWRTCIGWRHLYGVDDDDWPEDDRVIVSGLLLGGETFASSLHDTALAALRAAKERSDA